MKRRTDRILTTHVGSLPRPPELLDMMKANLTGEGGRAVPLDTPA
jgi:5-methyltetrahydropteroyltriglutamate--homocysteine methyltransferase